VSEDGVGSPDELRDDLREVGGVVLGIICRWRDVLALAVPTEVEEDAAILGKLMRHEPPDTAVAAVAVQAEESDLARG
jgi:hypothetical protein